MEPVGWSNRVLNPEAGEEIGRDDEARRRTGLRLARLHTYRARAAQCKLAKERAMTGATAGLNASHDQQTCPGSAPSDRTYRPLTRGRFHFEFATGEDARPFDGCNSQSGNVWLAAHEN
jgi:hypothetical protein